MNAMHRTLSFPWVPIVLAVAGCQPAAQPRQQPAPLPQDFLQAGWEAQEVPVAHIIRRDYRLREGDQLEIIYHVRHQRNDSYMIKIEDVITIRFPFVPSLNQTEQVQTDGTLHLDLIGSVYVFDKTIDQVREELLRKYSVYVKDPMLTVTFKESNVKIAELKKAITTSPRGQSRLVPITPDGTISLPFVTDIRAAGLTIRELHRLLNEAYLEIGLGELEVTVNMQSVSPVNIYVLGEVHNPGMPLNRAGFVTTNRETTLLQAIAAAGSYIPARADLSNVMLIRRRHLPHPQATIVNVHQLLENRSKASGQPVAADSSKYRYDIWLEDGDVVYVPTTEIAKRADYIDYVWTRGIRAVCGFSSSAALTYSVGDAVDWLGPNP